MSKVARFGMILIGSPDLPVTTRTELVIRQPNPNT
jgi:hypothetical protein